MKKLTSRKLWAAIAGLASGVGLCVSGNIVAGTAAIISSVLGYLVAEGLVDAAAASAVSKSIVDIVSQISTKEDEE